MAGYNTLSSAYTSALAELTGFIEETKKIGEEPKAKKKRPFFGKKEPVPRGEATEQKKESESTKDKSDEENTDDIPFDMTDVDLSLEDVTTDLDEDEMDLDSESPRQESPVGDAPKKAPKDDGVKHELVRSDYGKRVPGTNVTPRPRFREANELVPTISLGCAEEAVTAMRTLREVQGTYRRYLLVCIRDDGARYISRFRTKEAALIAMHAAMDFYINEIEPKDKMKVVYRDDGENEHIYEPTPENEIDEDGTIKRPSEIDNTLHRIETDTRGIVYFETKNATARWDVYDLEDAEPGDPDDPSYEQFKEDMIRKVAE